MDLGSIKKSYSKYRDTISFNKNIIIAAIITAVADVFIVNYVSLLYLTKYLLISIISLVADLAIFNIFFIVLYFVDNRSKYINSLDGTKINKESKKI